MPCPPQAGDLKHLAIPQRQLGEPWLNRSSLSKKNRNSSKLEIPVLINASTTTGSRLKFVPSAFRESSILEDSLGTRLKELATPSLGSLPTRLSQSCTLGGVPLLLHNDRGRDETERSTRGEKEEGRTERRTAGHASCAWSTLPTSHAYPPGYASPPHCARFSLFAWSSSPRATDHSTAKRGLAALMRRCATG